MKTQNNRTSLNSQGMTLVEIMIVLAIIGSLMAVLLPNIQSKLQKSKLSETKMMMNNVINALNVYSTDCGKYPKSLGDLMAAPSDCSNWGPDPYMKKAPQDAWKHDFIYELDGNNFTLKSLGADGREGGDKYDKDITQDDLQ